MLIPAQGRSILVALFDFFRLCSHELKKTWYNVDRAAEARRTYRKGQTDMKHYILYNPLAGTGDLTGNAWLTTMRDSFDGEVIEKDITTLSDRADYEAFLKELSPEDIIILCGGDGTINRFVNATDGVNIPQDICYFPAGTGNDFLKDINKVGTEDFFSIKTYLQNLPFVEVKGKRYRFLNNVGFGIDGYCCEVGDAQKAANKGKENPKPVNYTSIAIKGLLFHFKPRNAIVTVDGVEHRFQKVWLAPTMKGRYYGGGMIPTPKQDRTDPDRKLSVMVMHGGGKLHTLMVFPGIFKGEHITKKMVDILEGHDIRVVFERPCAIQIDGETILNVTEYHAMA